MKMKKNLTLANLTEQVKLVEQFIHVIVMRIL